MKRKKSTKTAWVSIRRFLKTWGTLAVAALALVTSVSAIYLDYAHSNESARLQEEQYREQSRELKRQYEELAKPHSLHEEIYDKLVMLDTKIARARAWIDMWDTLGESTENLRNDLNWSTKLSDEAEEAWRNDDYVKANSLINQAYDYLSKIPMAPGVTDIYDVISSDGVFTKNVTAMSEDGIVQLTINMGTTGKAKGGSPLSQVSILKMTESPALPPYSSAIGLVYDITPEGATFNPPITLTISYDPALIPTGTNQKNLVIITWDKTAGKWLTLEGSIVDPATHTISAPISHFTPFAVLAHTRPASFVISGLSIAPTQVNAGELVTIGVQVQNPGDLAGSYALTLKINNVSVATKDISVAGGTTQTVQFTMTQDAGGTYNVDVNGLTGTFTVKPAATPAAFTTGTLSISPAVADIGETVTISVLVTNDGDLSGTYEVTAKIDDVALPSKDITVAGHTSQQVTFTTSKSVAGTYTVTIDGLSGTFTVKPALPPPPTVINFWLIGGIIAVVVVLAVVVSITIRHKRES